MSLIQIQNAAFRYDGKEVVSELNFTIERGDYLCIVGENGSGKSTLIKGLLGLKAPHNGTITFGEGLTARQIGYLPQQKESQRDFPASVQEVVLSGTLNSLGFRPFYTRRQKKNALTQIDRVGMLPLKNTPFRELSGGQQQRALLARALAATQTLLILDEPISSLDPVAAADMYHLIEEINRNHGVTIVMVSHDPHAAAHEAGKVLHLENRQLFSGSAAAYRKSEIGKRFLGGESR
ncbi:MAG: ATP-binding cassette domain-containing protein [Eubacteriales bacterium]|jgi:zinc transport system ATP-binding protein|nr:ATP-binding cassette domain-containing protein [Eubacteriales bacterium]